MIQTHELTEDHPITIRSHPPRIKPDFTLTYRIDIGFYTIEISESGTHVRVAHLPYERNNERYAPQWIEHDIHHPNFFQDLALNLGLAWLLNK